ncbi:MAG: ImmA/IrrE family metallo-endopeptidase [Rhodanobacteraceae bacterium]|nr:ImmA/IrrE family metallo-endopeptidase [Rhodanobacteraceae bacterium]
MAQICFEVPALSRKTIFESADRMRQVFRVEGHFFPICKVLEFALPSVWPDFALTVGAIAEMGDCHGETVPERTEIRLREDVYAGLRAGKGRDRFTAAHELGHLLLHGSVGLARRMVASSLIKPYRNSEWQANMFAGALLVPVSAVRSAGTPEQLAQMCGVTEDAAKVRISILKTMGA